MADAPEVRWYRCGSVRWVLVSLYAFIGLLFGGLVLYQGIVVPGDRAEIPVGVVILLVMALLGRLLLLSGLCVAADHLIVREMFRRRRVPWADIASFECDRPPGWRGGTAIIVVCHDGRRLDSLGCSPDGFSGKKTRARAVELLRDLEAERQARTPRTAEGAILSRPVPRHPRQPG